MINFITLACLVAFACGGTIPQADDGLQGFIVGGKDIDIARVPYTTVLLKSGNFFCGGSIVSPTVIVTAAHCVKNKDPKIISVRAGSSVVGSGGVVVNASEIHLHPSYAGWDYDIAVIVLEKPFNYSKTIQPILLGTREPRGKNIVSTIGYGHLTEGGENAKSLQVVSVPMVEKSTCIENYSEYINITTRMVCAGVEGKDSCQGDSGGPLVRHKKLVGVVSFGIGCARKDLPGIYANVVNPEITSFIRKFMKK